MFLVIWIIYLIWQRGGIGAPLLQLKRISVILTLAAAFEKIFIIMTSITDIQKDCWDNSLHCLGTSYVFSEKANSAKKRIRLITILGIIVPLCLGGVAASYGANSKILVWAISIAAPLSILQLILSAVSLVYKWDDTMAYSLESQTDNKMITDEYQHLAKNPLSTIPEMQNAFDFIKVKDRNRETQDNKITFTTKDNRKGMRYALWIMRRACATCGQIPPSMNPSNCNTCGNF